MQRETKGFRAEVKADAPAEGATQGEFDARVAAFGNVDMQGDRIEEGAFDATKAAWEESGDPVPVIWSHQWDDPMAHIGSVAPGDLSVTPEGLEVHGVIDLGTPIGAQVHKLMVERRVKEFSFAYMPTVAEPDPDNPEVRVLKGLDLFELGPTLKGANPATELFGAKGADLTPADLTAEAEEVTLDVQDGTIGQASAMIEGKVGRVLSKANETKLRDAGALIDQVLASLGDEASGDEDGKHAAGRAEATTIDRTAARLRLIELEAP